MHAGLAALAVTAGLLFSGCSAAQPPIAAEVAQELQSEVHGIAVLAARGDTADAVAAAHALAARVRTAQADRQITGERAVLILERVEQLINRLVRSGAAPAPADVPQPLAGPVDPAAPPPPEPEPEPTETGEPDPTEEPPAPDPVETPEPVAPEPAPAPDNGSSGPGGPGGDSGNPGPGSDPAVLVPFIVDEVNEDDDDDGGKGRGRGRGRGGDD